MRPLWTYRPLLCMLGLHTTSERRASTLVKIGDLHHPGYRLVAECDRPRCTYSAEVAPAAVWHPESDADDRETVATSAADDRT